jgi:hypothetical protein
MNIAPNVLLPYLALALFFAALLIAWFVLD